MEKQPKEFTYENEKYKIDDLQIISNGGDLDEATKTIYVDRGIPEKFHEGIAVHEIEERKLILKGHSYVFSHNEAQKKELEFYEKVFGSNDKALEVLKEEEEVILTICSRRTAPKRTKTVMEEEGETVLPAKPIIEVKDIKAAIFEDKRYIINNSERLIGTLVDVYERGGIIYIDRDVPERFFEGLALHELTVRKCAKKGMGWGAANDEAGKIEEEYLISKYGSETGREILTDELKFQFWKFATERKELKSEYGGHKIIYEKDEILPK